ncbi:unnamed protein product, partial [Effrenium voratum]
MMRSRPRRGPSLLVTGGEDWAKIPPDLAKIVNFSTDCTGEPQEAGFFKSLLIADPAPATSSTSARFSLGQVTAGGVFKVCYCASLDACNSLEAFNHQAGQL